MSEEDKQRALTPSDPLLGYGAEKRRFPAAIALAAGAALVFVFTLVFVLEYKVPLPAETPVLALTRSFDHAPEYLPAAWQQAAQSRLPAVLGTARQNGRTIPFAIVPRWKKTELKEVAAGPLKILSENDLELKREVKIINLFSDWWRLVRHQAYGQVDFGQTKIRGSIDGTTWITDQRIKEFESVNDSGDLSINLEAFPEAWPPIAQALAQSAYPFELSQTPSALNLELISGAVTNLSLTFSEFSTRIEQEMAAALGKTDERSYALPDDTVVKELLFPTSSSTDLVGKKVEISIRQGEIRSDIAPKSASSDAETLLARLSPGFLGLGLERLGLIQNPNCTLRIFRLDSGFIKVSCE